VGIQIWGGFCRLSVIRRAKGGEKFEWNIQTGFVMEGGGFGGENQEQCGGRTKGKTELKVAGREGGGKIAEGKRKGDIGGEKIYCVQNVGVFEKGLLGGGGQQKMTVGVVLGGRDRVSQKCLRKKNLRSFGKRKETGSRTDSLHQRQKGGGERQTIGAEKKMGDIFGQGRGGGELRGGGNPHHWGLRGGGGGKVQALSSCGISALLLWHKKKEMTWETVGKTIGKFTG